MPYKYFWKSYRYAYICLEGSYKYCLLFIVKKRAIGKQKTPKCISLSVAGIAHLKVYATLQRLIIMYSMLPLHIFSVRFLLNMKYSSALGPRFHFHIEEYLACSGIISRLRKCFCIRFMFNFCKNLVGNIAIARIAIILPITILDLHLWAAGEDICTSNHIFHFISLHFNLFIYLANLYGHPTHTKMTLGRLQR